MTKQAACVLVFNALRTSGGVGNADLFTDKELLRLSKDDQLLQGALYS